MKAKEDLSTGTRLIQRKPRKDGEAKKKPKFTKLTEELQNATNSRTHRVYTRFVIILSLIIIVYFYTKNQTKETKFALVRENISLRIQKFQCSKEFEEEIKIFKSCVPSKCGRFVSDKLVDRKEGEILLDLVKRVFSKTGGGGGGASILDLHSGAVSKGVQFLNIFKLPQLLQEIRQEDLKVYTFVKDKIKQAISEQFGIDSNSLYLTYPTFFSRLTNHTALTTNDEYWHNHVDKETYESFHYTSLLYLSSYNKDFQGGRFVFDDSDNKTSSISSIEPKFGRISAFTSGSENRHHVEKVSEGERYAITISFTCNNKFKIPDPLIQNATQ